MERRDETLFGKIIDFVNEYFEDSGRSPSTREIEQGIGASRPTIQRYFKIMQEQGEIEYDGHRATIIVKDLSRLGRNYIETGRYVELTFPEYVVRFISIKNAEREESFF
ncbi:MAG: hypothetical protein ACI3XQ_09105 [Eubacteriales bacterium]